MNNFRWVRVDERNCPGVNCATVLIISTNNDVMSNFSLLRYLNVNPRTGDKGSKTRA